MRKCFSLSQLHSVYADNEHGEPIDLINYEVQPAARNDCKDLELNSLELVTVAPRDNQDKCHHEDLDSDSLDTGGWEVVQGEQ